MNKYISYTWLKYIGSTNKLSEFIWYNIFIKTMYIKNVYDKNIKKLIIDTVDFISGIAVGLLVYHFSIYPITNML